MNADELKTTLDLHAKWLNNEPDGTRADLTDVIGFLNMTQVNH